MTVVDFIDVIDDIIDLSNDEETVQQDHIATQPRATLLDRQAVFVLAGEGRQDAQAAFVSAVEGSQVATKSGNDFVANASPSVTEKTSLHTVESQNCPSSPTAPFPSPTSTTPKVLSSEVGHTKQDVFVLAGEGRQDAQAAFVSAGEVCQEATESGNALVATVSPSVIENAPLGTAESKNCPSSPTSAPLPSLTSTTPKAVTSEAGDTQLVATASLSVMEKTPLDTAESKNCPSSPASAPLPNPTSTTPKALTSEVGYTKLGRVRHPKKNHHISTPRRSPRFEQKRECCNSPVEQPAADHKRSRMLKEAEGSAVSTADGESTKTLSTDSTN